MFLKRRLGGSEDVEDLVHDLFVIVIDTIRRGELREPERLMGFVGTVLSRQLNAEIGRLMRTRQRETDLDDRAILSASDPTPEQAAITQQNIALMKQLLGKLKPGISTFSHGITCTRSPKNRSAGKWRSQRTSLTSSSPEQRHDSPIWCIADGAAPLHFTMMITDS